MIYRFLVEVETDDKHVDAPDEEQIKNEILTNLEFDSPGNGIARVDIETYNFSFPYAKEGEPQ